jgi:hypothetical protein
MLAVENTAGRRFLTRIIGAVPGTDERYPALVERALRLIEERGQPVGGDELCRELFGAPGGPWLRLLDRVLGSDARLRAVGDGHWLTSSPVADPGRSRPDPAGQPPVAAPARGWPSSAADGAWPLETADGAGSAPAVGRGWPAPAAEAGGAAASVPARADARPLADARPGVRGAADGEPPTPVEEPVGLVVLAAGPKPWRHPIVALGAARRRADGSIERWETPVRPRLEDGRPLRVPAYLARYGVVEAELDGAPALERALDELLAFMRAAPLAGLDVGLAVARLQFALRELGRPPLDNPTIELSVPGEQRPDLARLARAAGLSVPTRPTPAGLAALAAQLAAPRTGGERSGALGATAWRRLLDARQLGRLPDAPGVYRFEAADGRLLYVGKASSLRARLASYLTGSFPLIRQMPGLVEATERLAWEELPCELAARLREAELIAAERPAYNVQRRTGLALVYARLQLGGPPDPSGRRVPRLEMGEEGGRPTTAAAAQAALRRARAAWWPPRPPAAARPAPPAVLHRLDVLAAEAERELGQAEVAPGLRAADLAGLLVVAPTRRTRPAASTDDDDGDDWTRERRDPAWPPRELLDELSDDPAWPQEPAPAAGRPAAAGGALLVDPGGLRAVAALAELPVEEAQQRAAALAALADQPSGQAGPRPVGLAVLACLSAALARREPGVRAWAIQPGERG